LVMNNIKKKILILCVDFPPWPSIGAQRPASWCRYVDPNEFEIIVVTRKWKNKMSDAADYFKNPTSFPEQGHFGHASVYYADFRPNLRDKIILKNKTCLFYRILQKVLTAFYYVASYFLRIFDNNREIYYKSVEIVSRNYDIFMIVATGEPFITFRYAYLLSKRFGIPWCADYRDGWSTNYNLPYMPFLQRFVLKRLLGKLEKSMLKSASLVLTVTPALKDTLESHLNKPVHVVFNGYDPQEICQVTNTPLFLDNKFTISYLGSLYPFQPLEEFSQFIHRLSIDGILEISGLRIRFIGGEKYTKRIREAFNIIPEIDLHITPNLDRHSALKYAFSSHVLLLLSSSTVDGSAAKIYDYLALRRPIFVYKNDQGTIKFLLDYTKTGFLHDDYESSKQFFSALYDAYKAGTVRNFETNPVNLEEFSREYQAKNFFQLIQSYGRG